MPIRAGVAQAAIRYDAYGRKEGGSTGDPTDYQYGGAWGYEREPDTSADLKLDYLYQRYYDRETGRFISRDPIGYAGGLNLYAYCEGDPVSRVDPLGLQGEDFYTGGYGHPSITPRLTPAQEGYARSFLSQMRQRGLGVLAGKVDGFRLIPSLWVWEKNTRAITQEQRNFGNAGSKMEMLILLNSRFFTDNLNSQNQHSSRYKTIIHEAIHAYCGPRETWMGDYEDLNTVHGRVDFWAMWLERWSLGQPVPKWVKGVPINFKDVVIRNAKPLY